MDEQDKIYLSQIPKPRPSRLNAKTVSSLLDKLLLEKGYSAEQSRVLLEDAWSEAVGPALASQSKVGQIKRGVIHIYTTSDIARAELDFLKVKALKHLQAKLPEMRITGIRISPMRS